MVVRQIALNPLIVSACAGALSAALHVRLPVAIRQHANVFVIARQNDTWIEPASVAVLIGTFTSVLTLTSAMWLLQTGRLAFP